MPVSVRKPSALFSPTLIHSLVMKRTALLFLAAFLGLSFGAPARRPNIVLIVADDLGWSDLSSYGSTYYETPNIDSLAASGMRFTAAYACPNCAPTRAALMTGRYCPRTGIYTVGSGARGLEKFRKMIPVPNKTELALSEVTIAEELRAAGYRTASMGKWHLGGGKYLPTNQGFDINVGGNERGSPPRGGYFSPYHNPNLPDGPEGEYLTDRLTAEAVRFIKANRNRRFFLYLPHYAVHTPLSAKQDLVEKWKRKPPVGGQNNPVYAAMIASLDEGVGRVLKTIEETGIAKRTVVLFYSDNGGVGGYRRAGVVAHEITDNSPLRGGKGMLYEGGVRVPLIVRYPGVTKPGSICHTPVINVDFYPTLLAIAGITRPPVNPIDGTSFLPLLRSEPGAADKRPPLYWHFPGYLQGRQRIGSWRTTPAGAIRVGDYKLIEFFETGKLELYNLRKDLSEQHDLSERMPAKTRQLYERLKNWREQTGAQMPRPKTSK